MFYIWWVSVCYVFGLQLLIVGLFKKQTHFFNNASTYQNKETVQTHTLRYKCKQMHGCWIKVCAFSFTVSMDRIDKDKACVLLLLSLHIWSCREQTAHRLKTKLLTRLSVRRKYMFIFELVSLFDYKLTHFPSQPARPVRRRTAPRSRPLCRTAPHIRPCRPNTL